jgi:hypothetical protein
MIWLLRGDPKHAVRGMRRGGDSERPERTAQGYDAVPVVSSSMNAAAEFSTGLTIRLMDRARGIPASALRAQPARSARDVPN